MARVALVVGGSGAIGSEIARSLINDGMKVCATYFANEKKARELIGGFGKEKISLYKMDVTEESSVRGALGEILKSHKAIDVIVFSVSPPLLPRQTLLAEWVDYEKHINVHIKGLFSVVKCLSEQFRAKHKTKIIVILTEATAGKPPASMSAYVTAKYGLMGLAKVLSAELARYGSTVNMVSPGMTKTPLISSLPEKLPEIVAEQNPMKRLAEPKDIAGVVSFLASSGSDYLNGANILVNGGNIIA